LSAEFIIGANPDYVFLGDGACCGQTAAVVATRPGWDEMAAVSGGRVIVVDEALASRWGPRIVDFLRAIAEAIYEE
jgi:iron complex transport system substrate-binding protein